MAALGQWLLITPLSIIFVVLCGGSLVTAWIGSLVRRKMALPGPVDEEKSLREGFVLSSVMGLLALLVGFTFSLAIDRYDTRRENVIAETNAIGTTYLRAQLLEEPHRTRISRMLVEYTDNRIALAQSLPGATRNRLRVKNDALITELWTATVAVFPSIKSYDFSSSFLETMNQLIDMDTARTAGRWATVPPPVFALLFLYQYVAAAVLGFVMVGGEGPMDFRLAAVPVHPGGGLRSRHRSRGDGIDSRIAGTDASASGVDACQPTAGL